MAKNYNEYSDQAKNPTNFKETFFSNSNHGGLVHASPKLINPTHSTTFSNKLNQTINATQPVANSENKIKIFSQEKTSILLIVNILICNLVLKY